MKKRYLYIAASLLLMTATTACTEDVMDDINKKNNYATNEQVTPEQQLTDGIMSTGFSTSSGDFAFYVSSYTEQLVGVGANQFKNLELRNQSEVANSSTFDNVWNGTYANILNLKKALAKTDDGASAAEKIDVRAMLEATLAVNYGILTDMMGDIPCSEAANDNILRPKVDSQKDVYTEIFRLLDASLADLAKAKADGASYAGSQDLLFGGDLNQWEAYVYALKARYKLHLMHVDSNAAAEALAAAQKAKELGFEGAEITGFQSYSTSNCNPWAAFWEDRSYSAASKTVDDLLAARKDPRRSIYTAPWIYQGNDTLATAPATPGDEVAASTTYGTTKGEGFAVPKWLNGYRYPAAESASIHLLSKAELYFILAELEQRTGADYSADLKTAIEASFADYAKFGTLSESADDYYASLSSLLAANPLKEIITQKYLSQCRDEQVEAYNDLRRFEALGESADYITLTNPQNAKKGLPKRLPYGNSSVVANPAVKALYGDGKYVFSEPVWWAGGTR